MLWQWLLLWPAVKESAHALLPWMARLFRPLPWRLQNAQTLTWLRPWKAWLKRWSANNKQFDFNSLKSRTHRSDFFLLTRLACALTADIPRTHSEVLRLLFRGRMDSVAHLLWRRVIPVRVGYWGWWDRRCCSSEGYRQVHRRME